MMMMFILFLLVNKTICLFGKRKKKTVEYTYSKYICGVSRTELYILRVSLCKLVNDNITYTICVKALR